MSEPINPTKPKPIIKIKPVIKHKSDQTKVPFQPSSPEGYDDVVISFDVGIINLAYCIMRLDDTGIQVFDWDIINLADGDPKKTCSNQLKSGEKCTKKAYYLTGNKGVCKMHGNNSMKRNVTVENVTEWELKTMLFRELDRADKYYLKVNTILVESQPLKAREKIKGIGHALFDYYVLRGCLDQGRQYNDVCFIDAKNKLTVYDGPALSCSLKTQYARNKWYAVKYCQWITQNHGPSLLSYFESHRKKDDLADCLLQGLWYIKYGSTGKKPVMTSSHQKLVYRENNKIQYLKVRPRAPAKKSVASGRYTLSNIKWFMSRNVKMDKALQSSIEFYFGDLDYFNVLKNT